jgi:hypothetical protein
MIKRQHDSPPEQKKILPGTTEKIANDIVDKTYLAGTITVDHFGKPAGRQVFAKHPLDRV